MNTGMVCKAETSESVDATAVGAIANEEGHNSPSLLKPYKLFQVIVSFEM